MVSRDKAFPRKGTCKCMWYQRTTTFIDVLQDEYLLKQWGNRNVAWGMAHRPDLVLAASTCKRPSEIEAGSDDYRDLNDVVAEAQREAGDKIKAQIGTSLHKLTHMMDRGDTLGTVPERWVNDLRVYDEHIKSLGIEWVCVEQFRVMDKWVKNASECDHKALRYGGNCRCYGVAGTVDRIGWYKGRLRIFDIKTGSDFNKLGHAMQLAMYANMVPYQYPGDTRGLDVADLDLRTGYIIYLPEGKGECRLEAMDLQTGWRASMLAKQVWDARKWQPVLADDSETLSLAYLVMKARSIKEVKMLWEATKAEGQLDKTAKAMMRGKVAGLRAEGITE